MPFQDGDLLRLELQVAKRADKLSQRAGCGHGKDLVHWLQAEKEVLGHYFGFERTQAANTARGSAEWTAHYAGHGLGRSARAI
jgi:hypothetical protein